MLRFITCGTGVAWTLAVLKFYVFLLFLFAVLLYFHLKFYLLITDSIKYQEGFS